MKEKLLNLIVKPNTNEIEIVQDLADGKEATRIAVERNMGVAKVYETIAILKVKYSQATNASLVALFLRNKLIK